jgi:hypothetical protein
VKGLKFSVCLFIDWNYLSSNESNQYKYKQTVMPLVFWIKIIMKKNFSYRCNRTIGFRIESIIEELFSIEWFCGYEVSLDNLSCWKINWSYSPRYYIELRVLIPQWIKQKRNRIGGHCNHQAVKGITQYTNDNQVKLIHISDRLCFWWNISCCWQRKQ